VLLCNCFQGVSHDLDVKDKQRQGPFRFLAREIRYHGGLTRHTYILIMSVGLLEDKHWESRAVIAVVSGRVADIILEIRPIFLVVLLTNREALLIKYKER
jgi:hypothetical protein